MEDTPQPSHNLPRPVLNLVFRALTTAAGASALVLGFESSQQADADPVPALSVQGQLGSTALGSPNLILADHSTRTPLPRPANTLPGEPSAAPEVPAPQPSGADNSPAPAAPSAPVTPTRAPLPMPGIVLAGDAPSRPILEKPALVLPGDPNAKHDPAPQQPASPNGPSQPPAQSPAESGSGTGGSQTTTGQQRPGTEPDPAKVPNPNGDPTVSPAPHTPATVPQSSAETQVMDKITQFKPVLDIIAKGETNDNYNDYFNPNGLPPVNFTNMTIAEVLNWQADYINSGSKSSAVGRYQFIDTTLRSTVEALHIDRNLKFDEHMQDTLALAKLEQRGADDYVSGKISWQKFANNLSKEWASLPRVMGSNPSAGYYDGDGLNHSRITPAEVQQAIAAIIK